MPEEENIESVQMIVVDQADAEEIERNLREMTAARDAAMDSLGNYIAGLIDQAVQDRRWIEDRWIDDVRQLNGLRTSNDEYTGKSKKSHNITRVKANAAKARVSDLLFQTDGKNYSIVPDVSRKQGQEQAKEQADFVENIVADYLDDCDYDQIGRLAISSMCELGVGIVKGPFPGTKIKKTWQQQEDDQGNIVNQLSIELDTTTPVSEHCPTWSYFPDLSVANQKDCAYEFQQHFLTIEELQLMATREDFSTENILRVLKSEADGNNQPHYMQELRDDSLPQFNVNAYEIFEGYLSVPADKLLPALGCGMDITDQGVDGFDDDIEGQIECIVWVSARGKIIKLIPNPHELQGRPFRVACYDRDDSCFMASPGVPRMVRRHALAINSDLRRIDDNSDLSVGPQYIVDGSIVEPIPERRVDGKEFRSWAMSGNKGWRSTQSGADLSRAFHVFNIPSNLNELMAILAKDMEMADEATMLPQIMQGEQSASMTKTFQGMELLMNSANAIMRRVVKDWDDCVTVPMVSDYVDYIMQYRPIRGISGIFTANAKGTSALLLKETQSRNTLQLSQIVAGNPEFARRTDWDKLYKKIVNGFQIDPESFMLSDKQMKQQQQPQQQDIEALRQQSLDAQFQAKMQQDAQQFQLKMQADTQIAGLKLKDAREERENKGHLAELSYQSDLARLALQENITVAQLEARFNELVIKGRQKQEEVVAKSHAKENEMAQQFKIESTGLARI